MPAARSPCIAAACRRRLPSRWPPGCLGGSPRPARWPFAERQLKLQQALNGMDPIDREIIALRHFEELSNSEVATVLDLSKAAASNRYVRAMTRLQATLERMPGLFDRPEK